VRQICLSRQLIPQSFFDDLRRVPEPINENAIAISSISEEDRQRLTDKLRQEVSDDADCAVSDGQSGRAVQLNLDLLRRADEEPANHRLWTLLCAGDLSNLGFS
jgi:SWI/SNF-related matrix-associated actin-dependent regulator of chromatin subfamily A3